MRAKPATRGREVQEGEPDVRTNGGAFRFLYCSDWHDGWLKQVKYCVLVVFALCEFWISVGSWSPLLGVPVRRKEMRSKAKDRAVESGAKT